MLWKLKALGAGFLFDQTDSGGAGTPPAGAGQDGKPEDKLQSGQGTSSETPPSDPNQEELPDWATNPHTAYKMIKELRKEAEENRKKKEAADKEAKRIQDDALKSQGQFQALYEGMQPDFERLKSQEEQFKRYQEVISSLYQARIKQIPTWVQDLLKDKDPLDALTWLDANADKVRAPQAPDLDPGKRGNGSGTEITKETEAEIRRKYGIRN